MKSIKRQRLNVRKRLSVFLVLMLVLSARVMAQSATQLPTENRDSEKDVARYFVLAAIREAEDLDITEEELEFEFAKLADQYNMKIEDVKKALEGQIDGFRNELINRKIDAFLLENNE